MLMNGVDKNQFHIHLSIGEPCSIMDLRSFIDFFRMKLLYSRSVLGGKAQDSEAVVTLKSEIFVVSYDWEQLMGHRLLPPLPKHKQTDITVQPNPDISLSHKSTFWMRKYSDNDEIRSNHEPPAIATLYVNNQNQYFL